MLQPGSKNKQCLTCGKTLKGRPDKKFCDSGCRNSYNNRLKSEGTNFVRNVNNALLKNRRILERLLPTGEKTARANKEKLQELGFQFNYLTHFIKNNRGAVYCFCYEYGYLPLGGDWYLIVKRKDE
ncbi:MAG: hypothetical protein Q8941_08015 [Bacteroidota bacterium]|nr:hypothetical protein [Bacteroidota bacterium]